MKYKVFLIVILGGLLALGSCQKVENFPNPNGNGNGNNGNGIVIPNEIDRVFNLISVENTGEYSTTNSDVPVYQYVFEISTTRYTGEFLDISNLKIPRVHKGVTVYENPLKDAPDFNLTYADRNVVRITVRCEVKEGREEPLKFNISSNGYWFLALHMSKDDNSCNMNCFKFRKNGIDILDTKNDPPTIFKSINF